MWPNVCRKNLKVKMALAAKTARLALGTSLIDAQYLADRVIFINSKYVNISKVRRNVDYYFLIRHIFWSLSYATEQNFY